MPTHIYHCDTSYFSLSAQFFSDEAVTTSAVALVFGLVAQMAFATHFLVDFQMSLQKIGSEQFANMSLTARLHSILLFTVFSL